MFSKELSSLESIAPVVPRMALVERRPLCPHCLCDAIHDHVDREVDTPFVTHYKDVGMQNDSTTATHT